MFWLLLLVCMFCLLLFFNDCCQIFRWIKLIMIAPTIDISPQKAVLITQQWRQNVIKIKSDFNNYGELVIHLKFSCGNILIMENIKNFPEKDDGNFREKYAIFWTFFPPSTWDSHIQATSLSHSHAEVDQSQALEVWWRYNFGRFLLVNQS